MPVELRKRKAPAQAPAPPAKKQTKAAPKAAPKVKDVAVKEKPAKTAAAANGAAKPAAPAGKPVEGDVINLEGFGGEIETNDGTKTTLKALVDESKAGVVLFTYPKASTPGCTTQVCLFRDSYEPLTAGGLSIYGLSKDSPKANTNFKEKQKLPYTLLCDPKATLIDAIGMKKAPSGTQRGVFVVDKAGKVLACSPGGPAATHDVVKKLVESLAEGEGAAPEAKDAAKADEPKDGEAKEDGQNGDAKEDEEKAGGEKMDE